MTSALAALALIPAAYQFPVGAPQPYMMKAEFNGFVPVLGGNEGKVEVAMGLSVSGEAAGTNEQKAASEITSFALKFNEAPLPFGLEMVQDFFPRSVVTLTPLGKVTANTAPNRGLPVRLPGLDPRRLPDLTFIPVELPEEGLAEGKEWTFERTFGDAPMKYQCRIEAVDGDVARIHVRVTQNYEHLENEALESVTKESEAVAKVKTSLTGQGRIWFDLKAGAALGVAMDNQSTSVATPIKSGQKAERKLASSLRVTRGLFQIPKTETSSTTATTGPTPRAEAPSRTPQGTAKPAPLLDLAKVDWIGLGTAAWETGRRLWRQATAMGLSLDQVFAFVLSQIPIIGPLVSGSVSPSR